MNLAETALWVEHIFPGEKSHLEAGEVHLMIAKLGDTNAVVTEDLSRAETGLEADGKDLRVELMTLVSSADPAHTELAINAVRMASGLILAGAGPVQPGLLLPELQPGMHGVCIAPYVWEQGTPRIEEDDRLTVMLQLVLVTDEEYAVANEEGLEVLRQYLAAENINLNDLGRLVRTDR